MPEASFRNPGTSLVKVNNNNQQLVAAGQAGSIPRLSSLKAPIMLLMGHEGDIYTAAFSNDGLSIASSGFEHKIYMWDVYGECENYSVLKGHSGAVMELHFSADSRALFSCSTDKTVRIWDMETGNPIRRYKGHSLFVNSCHPARRGPQLVCSGSDDGTIKVWDSRSKDPTCTLQNTYQVTAVTFDDTAERVISGGIDNQIKIWDLRNPGGETSSETLLPVMHLKGHTDTVTALSLSPDGSHVLSNSMDCTARIWDIRPFGPESRCVKIFQGHQHNFEKNLLGCAWSPSGHRITCGSSDRYVYVWDVASRRLLYKLPGHQGSVNHTAFHPKEPILLSAGSDKKIYLGEIE